MKKRFLTAAVAIIMSLGSINAFATAEKITINGDTVDIPSDMGTIREVNDRTFVPLRFVSEYLGCSVTYNPVSYESVNGDTSTTTVKGTVIFTNPKTNISYYFTIGDDKLFVFENMEASVFKLNEPTFLGDDDRTYIPVRSFAEAMNYIVDWDEATQTVSLTEAQD